MVVSAKGETPVRKLKTLKEQEAATYMYVPKTASHKF